MPEPNRDGEILGKIERNTRLIAQLLTVTAGRELTASLQAVLDTPEKERAYALSDGMTSAREVGRQVGTTHGTVGRWWDEWLQKGLAVKRDEGRVESLVDIDMIRALAHLAQS